MSTRRDLLSLCVVVVACLLPFVAKPIHIDDPLYIWTARQIATDPLDFYGFDVNWYGYVAPISEVHMNPPIVSFYLAGIGGLLGWSEVGLHLGMIVPALALVLGTYALARILCASPLTATLASWATPVVLVSSTTLMSDVLMLSLWIWAVFFWVSGLPSRRPAKLVAAGVLSGLCALTKYFGITLVPLLAAYALTRERRIGAWALYLLIPVALISSYDLYVTWRYDIDPLRGIATYALWSSSQDDVGALARSVVGLSFAGGGLITILLFAPWLWSRAGLAAWGVVLGVSAVGMALLGTVGGLPFSGDEGLPWGSVAAMAVFAVSGGCVLSLAGIDLYRRRSADALLLALWVTGVWLFCSFINWTPTSRAILPMAPAAGILLARALEERRNGKSLDRGWVLRAPLVAGLCTSLAVAHGDTQRAEADRRAVAELSTRYGDRVGHLYFQGAWGFQHYMESVGATRLDLRRTVLQPGDLIVTPLNGSNLVRLPGEVVRNIEVAQSPSVSWLGTMSPSIGAGFYAAVLGPLPFVFGPNPPEQYLVQEVTQRLRLTR